MEVAKDRVQWQALVLTVLSLRVLLPDSYVTNNFHLSQFTVIIIHEHAYEVTCHLYTTGFNP
jgi:hypothetical protein